MGPPIPPVVPTAPALQTPEERVANAHRARRSQQLSGGDILPFAQLLTREDITGKITTAEMLFRLLNAHRHPCA